MDDKLSGSAGHAVPGGRAVGDQAGTNRFFYQGSDIYVTRILKIFLSL